MFALRLRRISALWLVVMIMASAMVLTINPASAATYTYGNLPLTCNAAIPFASTYDRTTVGGSTYYHGLSLDLPAASGVKVVAPAAGVAYVRYDSGYGNYVDVVESGGRTHRMAHMQGVGLVPNGTRVFKGQVLGLVGSTGASTGPHVHYEQRINGSQVAIQLEGPALVWGPRLTADGDRRTTHGLRSSNCISSPPPPPPPASQGNGMAVVGWSGNNIVMSESRGPSGLGWNLAVPTISNPTVSDACNFDGDSATEFISYEAHLRQFVMGNPRGDNTMSWSIILGGVGGITDFACLDWNTDGRGDIWARGSDGAVFVGYGNGARVASWNRLRAGNGSWALLGDPETVEACDLNGDGRAEIIAYEANRRFMLGRPSGTSTLRWDFLVDGIYNIDATTCGNFNPAHPGAELIGWQVLSGKGTYLIGEFVSNFGLKHWDRLTPTGFAQPFRGELDAGDIDRDGVTEFLAHEVRGGRHYIMVGDFTGRRSFAWREYANHSSFEDMVVGRFG
jgi:hypothetical protein